MDNFNFNSLVTLNVIKSQTDLKLVIKNITLPAERSGNFFLTCQQKMSTFKNESQCVYVNDGGESEMGFQCQCSNLTAGNLYMLELEHRLDGFTTRYYNIGNYTLGTFNPFNPFLTPFP